MTVSAQAMLSEIDRELAQRSRVYARMVSQGKMTQAKADLQIEIMRAVRGVVVEQAAKERLI